MGDTSRIKSKFISNTNDEIKYRYYHMFYLFIIGCVFGVIIEGIYCLFVYHRWESHVTFLFGPFNIVYGISAVCIYLVSLWIRNAKWYIKFIFFALLSSVIEFVIGLFQDKVLNSTSWSYDFLSIGKYISIPFTIAWGILGLLFIRFVMPGINKVFSLMKHNAWNIVAIIGTIFMAINTVLSLVALFRWGQRAEYSVPRNVIEMYIDIWFPSDFMQNRFVEWKINS